MKKIPKTNAMRKLDKLKLDYSTSSYDAKDGVDALHVANSLGVPSKKIFKTIVLEGPHKQHFVAVLSADHELALKKVAAHFGVKNVQLFPWRELKALTGYIRGGCSPIGMKRQFPTVIDDVAKNQDTIYVSAGEIGTQIVLAPETLAHAVSADFAEIRRKKSP
ncbi:Cys-tRNA(Pro) deacylase [Corynebacterium anserum]|uniref:Cys-tRNA(Pro)/Cys-tRNA(Cys) deacylase n=1 Tax=Corynebacterium anserum TaxID=2684406 RepID=A0A7G7YLT8_9CORY|nr:Cys-tRNA(Pro) deacylase [Corynebacterium anserum]MBC2681376.1 Cys-tRNA(Pro) deacylase [Corynebacterium anserum]QNH95458.1 Cys-tRNA(Pro) deacylase [Corynebacterium anserum]